MCCGAYSAFKCCHSLFTPNGNRFGQGSLLVAMGWGGNWSPKNNLCLAPPWCRSWGKGPRAGRTGSAPPGVSSVCYEKLLSEAGLGTWCPLLGSGI